MADPTHLTRAIRVLFYSDHTVTIQDDWFHAAGARPYTTQRLQTTAEHITGIGVRLFSMPQRERPQATTSSSVRQPASR